MHIVVKRSDTIISDFSTTPLPYQPHVDIMGQVFSSSPGVMHPARSEGRGIPPNSLKRDLASRFRDDREAYTEGKGDYVAEIMEKARREFSN